MATPIERLGKDALAAKGWFGAYKWLLLRRLVQAAIIALFIIGPIGGIWLLKGNLAGSWILDTVPLVEPFVFLQMLAAGMFGFLATTLIGVVLVVAFYALIGGRAYCAWVCPMNIVTDAAAWVRRKLGITQSAKISPQTRWWMLGAALVVAALTGQLAYELVNPVSILHRSLIFDLNVSRPVAGGVLFGIGAATWLVVVGIFLFDVLVAKHGWCSHVCPMGALYSLIGAKATVKVLSPNRAACDDCMECFEVCPEPKILPPALKQGMKQGHPPMVDAAVCTRCGRCIDICAKDVFAFGLVLPGRIPQERTGSEAMTSGEEERGTLQKAS